MKGKSKVTPEEIIFTSDSSDSDTGPFSFLHLKRRKLDKEILIWILEPEKFYIDHRYNSDMAYILYMEIAKNCEKDGKSQRKSTSTKNSDNAASGLPPSSSTNNPANFLLKGTIIQSSLAINAPHFQKTKVNGQNDNKPLGLSTVVKRVPGSTDLHAVNQSSGRSRTKEIKSHRGCSVS